MSIKRLKTGYSSLTIGIVGGGQLGRMIAFEAKRMGFNVVVLDPKTNAPAAQVSDEQIVAEYSDINALHELAKKSDVITYEFEHIDAELLSVIEKKGNLVLPSANTLKIIQNKYVQKSMLKRIGVNIPGFCLVKNIEDLKQAFDRFNQKIILKTCTDGYDGKGNIIIKHFNELEKAYNRFRGQDLIAEEYIDYVKEVSIIIAKNEDDLVYYPVAENLHSDSILIKSIVPANITNSIEERIRTTSKKIVEELDDSGIFCIEYFIDSASEILVNEIAPRPHNSGHYTIEACISSQFEQLVRIVCGLPLGSSRLKSPCSMYNILGSQNVVGSYYIGGLDSILAIPDCYLHLYGKAESDHLKKIGHITALDKTVELADKKAEQALKKISIHTKE